MITNRLLAVRVLTLVMTLAGGTAFAQAPPEGHEQHHPAGAAPSPAPPASESTATSPMRATPQAPPAVPSQPIPPAPPAPSMDMTQMMREMQGMMGGPAKKPLMSRLLEIERLSESDRAALRKDADQRIKEGLELLDRGTRDLTGARQAGDDAAVTRALGALKEGTELWETGVAVQRGLSLPPGTASATATRWFRWQMNLEVPQAVTGWPWGLSPVHLASMGILALTAGVGIVLYLYKIRRSLALLTRLTRGPQP